MKKFNVLAMLLIVSLSATVSGCGQITVKDQEACADLGVAGAACTTTFTSKRRDLTKAQWDKERIGWICTRASDYSDREDNLDEFCRTTNLCNYEVQQKVTALKANMKPLVSKAKSARQSGR